MPSELNTMVVSELHQQIGSRSDFAVFSYSGLTAEQAHGLRSKLYAADSRMFVVKNSLVRRALSDAAADALSETLAGPTAVALGDCDPSAMLKAMMDWSKDAGFALELKGGLIDGLPLTGEELKAVAKLPARDVLKAHLLATIMAPMTGLLRLLNEPMRRMVAILDQKAKQGADGEPAGEAG